VFASWPEPPCRSNGLIAVNVPLDPLRLGALRTRTTHPFYIARWNDALTALSIEGRIENHYWDQLLGLAQEGISSTGWATFLQAVVEAGYAVVGTWPLRTEMANRMIAAGTNALANSVVLVCRKKDSVAEVISRAEFIRALKRELPSAIGELQAANIAPADMPQSAIGPGMGVFSRYKAVLESDDSPMSVKETLSNPG